MITLATRGKFGGGTIGIATAGRFNSSLISRIIKAAHRFVTKSVRYIFVTKGILEK